MNEFSKRFQDLFAPGLQGVVNIVDILLVTYLVYRLLKLVRGTRVWRVVLGIGVFIAVLGLSDFLGFKTLHWILEQGTLLGPVALVILFLPELRQALEGFARFGIWGGKFMGNETSLGGDTLQEIVSAVAEMAEQRTGALIILERGANLDAIAENGVPVRAQVTAALLGAIFNEGSPLHDGATLIRHGQIIAAACRLPLSESVTIDSHYHMRHRAGVGITEEADCVAIIVSEERGHVTVAIDGKLIPMPTGKDLRELLNQELRGGLSKSKIRRKRERRGPPIGKAG